MLSCQPALTRSYACSACSDDADGEGGAAGSKATNCCPCESNRTHGFDNAGSGPEADEAKTKAKTEK